MLYLLFATLGLCAVLSPPYKQDNWIVNDDAQITDSSIILAGSPGQSGSVWSKNKNLNEEWTMEAVVYADADFNRDAHSSGFALWYVDQILPQGPVHGSADKWDGLSLMVDTLDNLKEGSIRAHLNDKNFEFTKSSDLETDALSLCRMTYRKSKSPITIKMGYSKRGFVVSVNGQSCFSTQDIVLPNGYFGLSANSDETADKLYLRSISVIGGMDSDLVELLEAHIEREKLLADQGAAAQGAGQNGGSGSGGSGGVEKQTDPNPVPPPQENVQKPQDSNSDAGNTRRQFPPVQFNGVKEHEVSNMIEERLAKLHIPTYDHLDSEITQLKSRIVSEVSDLVHKIEQTEQNVRKELGQQKDHQPNLLNEINELKAQLLSLENDAASKPKQAVSNGPSLLKIGVVVVLLQIIVLKAVSMIKARESHPKLL